MNIRYFANLLLLLRADLYHHLQHIYSHIYVEYVARNPLYRRNPDDPIDCPLFTAKMEEYIFDKVPSR